MKVYLNYLFSWIIKSVHQAFTLGFTLGPFPWSHLKVPPYGFTLESHPRDSAMGHTLGPHRRFLGPKSYLWVPSPTFSGISKKFHLFFY